jgi:phytoene/squalene synthetase
MKRNKTEGKWKMNQVAPSPASLRLSGTARVAEAIAARDNNNLYRACCFFRDAERYQAFCAYYAVMRVVDDRVDSLPSRAALSPDELAVEYRILQNWHQAVLACHRGERPVLEQSPMDTFGHQQARDLLQALADAFRRFPVPIDLWNNFFKAMNRDVEHVRFATYQEFLQYAEGATVAPTTIGLFLLAAQRQENGQYRPPSNFDLVRCGRALGRFAYLGHILRDLPDDLATGEEGMLYLAADDMRQRQLTETMLFDNLAAGCSSEALRNLTAELVQRARDALAEGQSYLAAFKGRLDRDCVFILQLIIAIYEAVLDKIAACGYDTLAQRHRLTSGEKERIVLQVVQQVGYREDRYHFLGS